jgi:hypothetical protein
MSNLAETRIFRRSLLAAIRHPGDWWIKSIASKLAPTQFAARQRSDS